MLSELNKAITERFAAELSLNPVSGNPITGFQIDNFSLLRSDKKLIEIDKAELNLSFISLIKGKPRLSLLKLDGIRSDYDSLLELMPEQKFPTKELDIPIDKIRLGHAEIGSPWGILKSEKSSVRLLNSFHYDINFKGSLAEKKLYVAGTVKKDGDNWQYNDGSIVFNDGKISIDGSIYPQKDFKLKTHNLDLSSFHILYPKLEPYGIKGHLFSSASVKGIGAELEISGGGEIKDYMLKNIPLPMLKFEAVYHNNLLKVELLECQVFNSSLCGKLIVDKTKEIDELDFDLHAENLKFNEWTDKLIKNSTPAQTLPKGNIKSLDMNIKGPVDSLSGEIKIAPSNIEYGKLEFKDFYGNVLFNGSSHGTVDFYATHNNEKISLKGKCSLAKNSNSNLTLTVPAISLEDLDSIVPDLQKYNITGMAKTNLSLERKEGDWSVNTEIFVPFFNAKNEYNIKNLKSSFVYNFKNKQIEFKNISANFNDAEISGVGIFESSSSDEKMNFTGTIKNADSSKFYNHVPFFKNMDMRTTASGTWTIKGSTSNPLLQAKIASDGGKFRNMTVDKFATDITYSDNKLLLSPMKINGYGGKSTMSCSVIFPTQKQDGSRSPFLWNLDGDLDKVHVSAINDALKSKEKINGNCTASFNVKDDGDGLFWKAKIMDGDPKWREFSAKSLSGEVSGTTKDVSINNVYAKFLHGNATINGKIGLADKTTSTGGAVLDLKILTDELNLYELLRKHLPSVRGVQGLLKSEIHVKGPASTPTFSGIATLQPLRYRDFLLPEVSFNFNADYKNIDISNAKAILKDGSISGSGKIYKKDNNWETLLNVEGDRVDLRQFGAYLPEKVRDRLGGRASFELHGDGKLGSFTGKGQIKSNWLRVMGIRFTNLNAPFYIADGYAFMEDVNTDMNGGILSGGIAVDLKKNVWGGMLTALDINMDSTVKQFLPNIKGAVTGKADLKIRGQGETGRLSTVNGSGVIIMKDGSISEFDAVEAAMKYTSGKPLRFESVQATFTFDGGNIAILPGSQALAPEGDPVYRYVMLDGLVNNKQEVALFAMGKVNIRALNALLGALQGVISVGTDLTSDNLDKNEMLKNFLGGVLSGYTRNEFSFITMNINGKIGALQYSNVKVDKNTTKPGASKNIPKSDSDPEEKTILDGNTKIKINFEIPVGPGKSKTPDNIKDKVVEQTLENLLNNLNFGL